MRVFYEHMRSTFQRILVSKGMLPERAADCGRLFADASRDGVASHGLNRFPGFVRNLVNGRVVDPNSDPVLVNAAGAVERWDGQHGVGPLNADFCMRRAMSLASEHGMGSIGLRNTNHWMRPANYGYLAASSGFAAMCWTNTMANMPGWGGDKNAIGNNPLVIACPNPDGEPVVLDMAMSQYSFGKMIEAARRGERLDVIAGVDEDGEPTDDPGKIMKGGLAQPAGLWKGAGLAIMLDLLATVLSGGNATWQISIGSAERGERAVSQTYIAWDLSKLGPETTAPVPAILSSLHETSTSYPGERSLKHRADALQNGIPVEEERWQEVLDLLPHKSS